MSTIHLNCLLCGDEVGSAQDMHIITRGIYGDGQPGITSVAHQDCWEELQYLLRSYEADRDRGTEQDDDA